MRVDVLVIGAELDGAVAAMRLAELGRSVCIVTAGAGSLSYAAGGVHVLGYVDGDRRRPVEAPLDAVAQLDRRHPYALAGRDRIAQALAWFATTPGAAVLGDASDGIANRMAVTPAGLAQPVLLPAGGQATFDRVAGRTAAILQFDGHRDFPVGLLLAAFERAGLRAQRVGVAPPAGRADNFGLARAFDQLPDVEGFFARLRPSLPRGAELALAPAVLGLHRHGAVIAAAAAGLGIPVLEVPTLPPSVPGMRWADSLDRLLGNVGCTLRKSIRIARVLRDGDRIRSVTDENGREVEASAYVVATGGVLMGGLAVDASGAVSETTFGLEVVQTEPLRADSAEAALAALHATGVETDDQFHPCDARGRACGNVFVTGRTLAHWHPAREISAEGVSIVSGWVAAEAAHAQLED